MLSTLNRPPYWVSSKARLSCARSTPGTGTWATSRKMTSMLIVKSILRLRSAILKAFMTAWSIYFFSLSVGAQLTRHQRSFLACFQSLFGAAFGPLRLVCVLKHGDRAPGRFDLLAGPFAYLMG